MKAKKRWTSSIRTESEELIEKISWNSSSSEESGEEHYAKKFKPYFPKFEQEMKLDLRIRNPIEIKKIHSKKERERHQKCYTLPTDISTFESDRNVIDFGKESDISTFVSETNSIDFGKESPILKTKPILSDIPKADSPIISQNYLFREISPVLTDKEIIKKIKRKKKELVNRTKIDGSSPEKFLSQKSKIIEENDSPEKTFIATTTCSQDLGSIELISSQESSSLEILNPVTSESSIQSSDLSNQCYHQPSPRRKHCKKNGLLYQLQKSLNLQKSRVSLWHHDIFCKNVIPSNVEHIQGIINDKWKDFSCTILKCSRNGLKQSFLISLGCNTDTNLVLNTGIAIKIFPPFKEKLVCLENEEVKLYYNISKILTESKKESDS